MRVVADTNVMVSAMLWIGTPHTILMAAEDARLTLCVSPALLQELEGVLQRPKFSLRLRELQIRPTELTAGYARIAHVVLPRHVIHLITTDPADNQVLACALTAHAKYIVSGDSDLLRLRSYKRLSILSPSAFVRDVLSHT